MPSSSLKAAEIDEIITEVEGGTLPAVVMQEKGYKRPYADMLTDVRDKMNETSPTHFIDVVQPLRDAARAERIAKGRKDVPQDHCVRAKRASNNIKNTMDKYGDIFKLADLIKIETDLQAALVNIALLKTTATDD